MAISKIAKLTLATGENTLRGGVLDKAGGFLYFLCHTIPGKVVKIRLSDFTAVATLTFATGENEPRAAVVDSVNGFLYVCCYTSPGKVVKIRLSDFTAVGTLTFPTLYNCPWSLIVDPSNNYLYAFCYAATYDVVRINLAAFTVKDYLTFNLIGHPHYDTARFDLAGGLGYVTTGTNGRIVKVNLSAFSVVGSVLPASALDNVSGELDLINGYYFHGTGVAPSKISRVILSSFLSDTYITLSTGESYVNGMCVNPGGKLLFAFCNWLPGKVVRIAVDTFTRKDVYDMPTGDNYPYVAVIDESSQNIYVGTDTSPGTVIKLFDGDIVIPAVGSQHLPIIGIG